MSQQNGVGHYGLGTQTAEFKVRKDTSMSTGIILAFVGGGVLAVMILLTVGVGLRNVVILELGFGFGLLMFIGGIRSIVKSRQGSKTLVTVFTDGFVYHKRGDDIIMRWDNIDVDDEVLTVKMRRIYSYRILRKDGVEVRIDNTHIDVMSFGAVLKAGFDRGKTDNNQWNVRSRKSFI